MFTVPPDASEPATRDAMDPAAEPGNRTHTPALLATIPASPVAGTPAATAPEGTELSIWEWEGGLGS
jgi:hypothetical protein